MMKKKLEDFHMQLTIKHPFLCLPVVSHPKDTRVLKLFDGEKLLLVFIFLSEKPLQTTEPIPTNIFPLCRFLNGWDAR